MSHSVRPLRIAIISHDPAILHELSWMLSAVGYTVATSHDTSESAAWRQFNDTDFVLFDGRTISNPTDATLELRSNNPVYRIFLYDPAASMDITAWFSAGANDGLRVPVSRGELLARIRAGARVLEFENRMRSQSSRSRVPGMLSTRGLLRKLSKFTTAGKSVTLGHTLLTTTIDFFAGVCREEGEAAARSLLASLANSIQQSIGGNAITSYNDDGTFHVLLPGRKVPAARLAAEQIAQKFGAAQADREPHARLSVTTALVPWQVGVRAEELLEQGKATLAVAAQSGGDCIVEQDEFAHERSTWQNELTSGSPFANVIAQDVMEPFPAVLNCDSPNPAVLAALRRSGAPVWPYVDRDGRLVGVASGSVTDAGGTAGLNSHPTQALTNPVTIAHDAAFPEIYETFSTNDCLAIVVVANHRPVGYLRCSGFLSLIEPVNSATFAGEELALKDSRSLLVSSLVNEFEPASGSDQ